MGRSAFNLNLADCLSYIDESSHSSTSSASHCQIVRQLSPEPPDKSTNSQTESCPQTPDLQGQAPSHLCTLHPAHQISSSVGSELCDYDRQCQDSPSGFGQESGAFESLMSQGLNYETRSAGSSSSRLLGPGLSLRQVTSAAAETKLSPIRITVPLWQVPHLGLRIISDRARSEVEPSFDVLRVTEINFGKAGSDLVRGSGLKQNQCLILMFDSNSISNTPLDLIQVKFPIVTNSVEMSALWSTWATKDRLQEHRSTSGAELFRPVELWFGPEDWQGTGDCRMQDLEREWIQSRQ